MDAIRRPPITMRRNVGDIMTQAKKNVERKENFQKGLIEFATEIGHMLETSCQHVPNSNCMKCLFEEQLQLPELPEMVFPRNRMIIRVGEGTVEFNALDALKMVNAHELPNVVVGPSKAWQDARRDRLQEIKEQHKPYDWTFTTKYRGSVHNCNVSTTMDKIDYERFKVREKILFTSSADMYEDELADHGIARLLARVRVMESGYFLALLRLYMRVDNVLIRVCDTRVVGNVNETSLMREWQLREARLDDVSFSRSAELMDFDQAWMHLPIIESIVEKIEPKM